MSKENGHTVVQEINDIVAPLAKAEPKRLALAKSNARMEDAFECILKELGVKDRPGCEETPQRVAKMYREICKGIGFDCATLLTKRFNEGYQELIAMTQIPFYSICEHHFIPFHGVAHVAYIPNSKGEVVGLSKIARLVDMMAKQPQVQERLTHDIADVIEKTLEPVGTMVMMQAEHLCMTMRGIEKPGSITTTSSVRGVFRDPKEFARQEFLACIQSTARK